MSRTLRPSPVELFVITRRAGLLSGVGHDLQLRATDLKVHIEASSVTAEISASGLRVVSALRGDRGEQGVLSPSDQANIERNIATSVLNAERFPTIRFEGQASDQALTGTLMLHGHQKLVRIPWKQRGAWREGELMIDHRDFGIPLFQAFLGALKVQPQVRIQLRLQWGRDQD